MALAFTGAVHRTRRATRTSRTAVSAGRHALYAPRAVERRGDDSGWELLLHFWKYHPYACYPPPVPMNSPFNSVLIEAMDGVPFCDRPSNSSKLIAHEYGNNRRWEQCSVWWDTNVYEFCEGGQFEWVDGRSLSVCRNSTSTRWSARTIPFTWVKLSEKTMDTASSSNELIVCFTHLEAGHDWNEDCPAKRNSARCVRACVGTLHKRFRFTMHIVVPVDFNARKLQLPRRLLTGEGSGMDRSFMYDDAKTLAAEQPATASSKPGYEKGGPSGDPNGDGDDDGDGDGMDDSVDSDDVESDDSSILSNSPSYDHRIDLVDVFDAVDEDNPVPSFCELDHGIRSGGH